MSVEQIGAFIAALKAYSSHFYACMDGCQVEPRIRCPRGLELHAAYSTTWEAFEETPQKPAVPHGQQDGRQ